MDIGTPYLKIKINLIVYSELSANPESSRRTSGRTCLNFLMHPPIFVYNSDGNFRCSGRGGGIRTHGLPDVHRDALLFTNSKSTWSGYWDSPPGLVSAATGIAETFESQCEPSSWLAVPITNKNTFHKK